MKTVSTKLNKSDHERFVDLCNYEGCSVSEALRNMVQQRCITGEEAKYDNSQQKTQTKIKTIPEVKNTSVVKSEDIDKSKSHYDSFGNYWTFNKKTSKWTCHMALAVSK